ncbi:hypothetical protein [Chondrinema litorale]
MKNNIGSIMNKVDKNVIDELYVNIPSGTVDMRDDRKKETW